MDLHFSTSSMDSSLFILSQHHTLIYVFVYVDDILITGNDTAIIFSMINQLQHSFAMKDLGNFGYFLGIEAHRTSAGLHIRQSKYIFALLHRAGMIGAKLYVAPSVSGTKLSSLEGTLLSEADLTNYRQLVGDLQYCTLTRPDLTYSVNQLCQFMHSPTTSHWVTLKRVLYYLKDTIDHELFYSKGKPQINIYCDSDWAGDPDNCCSITGYGVFLVLVLFLGVQRSNRLSLSQVSRLSIEPYHMLLLKPPGSECC